MMRGLENGRGLWAIAGRRWAVGAGVGWPV